MVVQSKPTIILIAACFLLIVSCELFNYLPENNLEKKMDDAVAWANADKLTVHVAYPE